VFKQVEHGIELGFDAAKDPYILSDLVVEIFVLDARHIQSRPWHTALDESSPLAGPSALVHAPTRARAMLKYELSRMPQASAATHDDERLKLDGVRVARCSYTPSDPEWSDANYRCSALNSLVRRTDPALVS
jgi:hypothetical protein